MFGDMESKAYCDGSFDLKAALNNVNGGKNAGFDLNKAGLNTFFGASFSSFEERKGPSLGTFYSKKKKKTIAKRPRKEPNFDDRRTDSDDGRKKEDDSDFERKRKKRKKEKRKSPLPLDAFETAI